MYAQTGKGVELGRAAQTVQVQPPRHLPFGLKIGCSARFRLPTLWLTKISIMRGKGM